MNYIIKCKRLIWLLLIIPLIPIPYLETINIYNIIMHYYKVIAMAIITFIYIGANIFKPFKFKSLFIVLPYTISLILTTSIHNANVSDSLIRSFNIILMAMLVDLAVYYNANGFLHSIYCYFVFLVFSNFILQIMYPSGLFLFIHGPVIDKGYLLGVNNTMVMILLPAMAFIIFYSYYRFKRISIISIIAFIISDISILISKSSTSIISCTFATILLIIVINKSWRKLINIKILLFIYTGIVFFFVIFQLQFTIQNDINQLLHIAFSKDITFDGRTTIWKITESLINKSPITGYGVPFNKNYTFIFIYNQWMHAHNGFLQIMYEGGTVTLVGYLFILMFSFYCLYKERKNNLSIILICFIFSFMIQLLTEPQEEAQLFICMLITAMNIERIIKVQDKLTIGYEYGSR